MQLDDEERQQLFFSTNFCRGSRAGGRRGPGGQRRADHTGLYTAKLTFTRLH